MKEILIERPRSRTEAAYAAAHFLNKVLERYENEYILLLVSGGSSLPVLDYLNLMLLERVTVGLVDERITKNPKDRNMTALKDSAFHDFVSGIPFLAVHQGTPKESALRYEKNLRAWFARHDGGRLVILLGIGEDGHTAGIMPFPENPRKFTTLFNGTHWVTGYDAGDKNPFPHRVTVTNTLLRRADEIAVFACGKPKREALASVLSPKGTLAETPARVIKEASGEVVLFTDQRFPV